MAVRPAARTYRAPTCRLRACTVHDLRRAGGKGLQQRRTESNDLDQAAGRNRGFGPPYVHPWQLFGGTPGSSVVPSYGWRSINVNGRHQSFRGTADIYTAAC